MRTAVRFGMAVILWNVAAAVAAVVANWPSQFGRVGTDAGADVIATGTAISAPLLPIALLVVSLLFMRLAGKWAMVGLVGYTIVAALFLIGGAGEVIAPGTADTPKAVLVVGGLVAVGLALVMLMLAVQALRERRRTLTHVAG